MYIISKSEWGARPPKSTTELPWKDIDAIAIHYTAAKTEVLDPGGYYARLRAIQNMHMAPGGLGVAQGGADIAYNFLFSPTGLAFQGRGWNIMSGATKGHNSHTVAFCFMGMDNVNRDDVMDKGRRVLSELIFEAELLSGKKVGPSNVQHAPQGQLAISGHKIFVNTACPGDELLGFIATRGWEAYRKVPTVGYPRYFFNWAAWWLGEGIYKQYGPRNKAYRPKNPKTPVSSIYWLALQRFIRARQKTEV